MLHLIKPKSHDEWLEHRTGGIGSSEVATIVGVNPYETPYQLWRRKTGLDAPVEENEAMLMGHLLEPIVAQRFLLETGSHVIKASAGDWIVYDDKAPHRRVSPDRLYWRKGDKHSQQTRGILECKTSMTRIDEDSIPPMWFCQLQYQMGVMGLKHGALAWLVKGREFGYKEFAFLPDLFIDITQKVDTFWLENIRLGIEPELKVYSTDTALKYRQHMIGKSTEALPDVCEDVMTIKTLKAQRKQIDEQLEQAEYRVKHYMQDSEMLTLGETTLATWKTSKASEKLDTKALMAAYPDICREYMVQSEGTRRFVVK